MKKIERLNERKLFEMGKRIKEERKKRGLKAIDFADIIGIGVTQLSRIENGKVECKLEYLDVISKTLDINLEYIVYGKQRNFTKILSLLEKLNQEECQKVECIIDIIFGTGSEVHERTV